MITWIALVASLLLHDTDEISFLGFIEDTSSLVEVRISEGEPEAPHQLLVVPDNLVIAPGHVYTTTDFGVIAAFHRKHPDYRVDRRVIGFQSGGDVSVDFPGLQPVPLDHRRQVLYLARCDAQTWSSCLFIHSVEADGSSRDARIDQPVRLEPNVGLLKVGSDSVGWFDAISGQLLVVSMHINGSSVTRSYNVPCKPLAYSRKKEAIICLSSDDTSKAFLFSLGRQAVVREFRNVEGLPVGFLHETNELLIYTRKRSLVSPKEISELSALDVNGRERTLIRPFPVTPSTLTYFD